MSSEKQHRARLRRVSLIPALGRVDPAQPRSGLFEFREPGYPATLKLVSPMPVSILVLFVIVIDRARAGSRTSADECTLPAAN